MPDLVILLHGIARTQCSMRGMERALQGQGYRTLNIHYPSTRHTLEELVALLHHHIGDAVAAHDGQVHAVTHSMGGLLIRAYIHQYRLNNLGRVVMLAPPNHGSKVADFLQRFRLYRIIYGPAGQQLGTKQLPALPGMADYPLGIIAGNRSLAPLSSRIIGAPSDGKVSVESTKLHGMQAHAVIPATHTFIMNHPRARALTAQFLKSGRFS